MGYPRPHGQISGDLFRNLPKGHKVAASRLQPKGHPFEKNAAIRPFIIFANNISSEISEKLLNYFSKNEFLHPLPISQRNRPISHLKSATFWRCKRALFQHRTSRPTSRTCLGTWGSAVIPPRNMARKARETGQETGLKPCTKQVDLVCTLELFPKQVIRHGHDLGYEKDVPNDCQMPTRGFMIVRIMNPCNFKFEGARVACFLDPSGSRKRVAEAGDHENCAKMTRKGPVNATSCTDFDLFLQKQTAQKNGKRLPPRMRLTFVGISS